MKKKIFDRLKGVLLIVAALCALTAQADVADPNVWLTVKVDGIGPVSARWVGDEFFHFLLDADGNTYMANDHGTFSLVDKQTLEQRREASMQHRMNMDWDESLMRKLSSKESDYFPEQKCFLGKKKGLAILVEFSDDDGKGGKDASTAFKFHPEITGNTLTHWNNFFNTKNFTEGKFVGSVHDYFYDQSYGKFDLTFDVVGPVTLSKNSAYYSGNNYYERTGEMAQEAFLLADELVDYSKYDWNGDGRVNQVAIIYAGGGLSCGGTIWPHKFSLTDCEMTPLTLDGMTVDVYCVSNELTSDGDQLQPMGIGTFIHEYSHCFGFPDLYDVNHYSGYGVGFFDVMGSGEKNGKSYIPAGYSAYERMVMGWLDPVVLNEPCKIRGMQPLTSNGETYIFYTDNPDSTEYYIMENRQRAGWDADLPAYGLLVYRVDFLYKSWLYNVVNSPRYTYNRHERFRVINADDKPLVTYANGGYYVAFELQKGVPFPQPGHNKFTDSSSPQMVQFNGTDKKQPLYGREMTDITQNDDGTISFDFHLPGADAPVLHGLYLDETASQPVAYEASADELTRYNVHTNLTFKTNRWLTLWLPFALSGDEVKTAFGEQTRVATFIGGDNNSLRFATTEEGIPANTPVLIYLTNDYELAQVSTIPNRYVPMASNGQTEAVATKSGPFSFVGVGNTTTVPKGCLFLSNGVLYQSVGSTTVKAFRGYFRYEGNNINSIFIDIDDSGQQTYVDGHLVSVDDKTLGDIYSLDGMLVSKDAVTTEGLPKGIYLLNGKKIVVR